MLEQTKLDVEALCQAAERMLTAANNLWAAHNPEDAKESGIEPLSLEEAQEAHSEAFQSLQRAIYYARKDLGKEALRGREMLEVITQLLRWEESMGGWENPIWRNAEKLVARLTREQIKSQEDPIHFVFTIHNGYVTYRTSDGRSGSNPTSGQAYLHAVRAILSSHGFDPIKDRGSKFTDEILGGKEYQ